ncbi:MAG TPA: glycosyltransferase family 4 protein [Candidatus Moranbacteria bacterium]|nr:glycosyltransferase family 4 protein [Candidatus Moranbacteria bacterium]
MKIAINCCDLDSERIDGTRVYIKNLLNHFGSISTEDEFWLFHKKEFNPALAPKMFSNYRDCKIPYPFWWTQTRFPYEIKREGFDVVWMPIQQIPLMRDKNSRYVVTIHDLAWKYFPQNYEFINRLKLDFFAETAIKRADRVVAISESTKKDILKFYPQVDANKVSVVYHGFERKWLESKFSSEQKKQLEGKYQITDKNYLLYVGGLDDKENVAILIEAFNQLKKQTDFSGLKLVLVGEEKKNSKKTWAKIKKSFARKDIIVTGRIEFTELAWFYQGAKAFVLPSKYEGFGLPVLEAFVAQVPVIAVNRGASLEIGQDAAIYFDGENTQGLVQKLEIVLSDEAMAKKMIKRGLERANDFSWRKCAEETLAVIKSQNNKPI